MVIISYYLKVCLSPGFPLARSPGHRPRGPSGLLACFLLLLLSQCVNELSVPRPPQGSRPRLPPRPVSGLPAVPVIPLFPFGGAKVHLFFEPPNFFGKIFRKVFFPRLPSPLPPSLARPAPAEQDRKSTAFLQSAKLFSRNFLRKSSIR